jgi:GT2 family glycosyltransferase
MENYVIIVNWNAWKDTVECLESVLRMTDVPFRVVVCDNGSDDGSLDYIRQWAAGALPAPCANPSLQPVTSPPVSKPVPHREFSREEVDHGVSVAAEQLVIIRVGADLMYAGGNNVGLRYALQDPHARYFWILNNDTVVDPKALAAMVESMRLQPSMGMCGSMHLAYYNPTEVQVQGGRRYSRWTGRVISISSSIDQLPPADDRMDYIHGASVLVSRAFIEEVGLIDESYYIYFEELDWAERARGKFTLGYASQSVIYHKEGATLGTNFNRKKRSLTSETYSAKNRVVFARRYCPWTLPTVILTVFAIALHRCCTGNLQHGKAILAWGCKGLLAGNMPKQIPAAAVGRST